MRPELETAIQECLNISKRSDNIWLSLAAHNCSIAIRRNAPAACGKAIGILQCALDATNDRTSKLSLKEIGRMTSEAQETVGW